MSSQGTNNTRSQESIQFQTHKAELAVIQAKCNFFRAMLNLCKINLQRCELEEEQKVTMLSLSESLLL